MVQICCKIHSDVWSCPSGYVMMWERCVRISQRRRKFVDAESDCAEEGAELVRPQTKIEVS